MPQLKRPAEWLPTAVSSGHNGCQMSINRYLPYRAAQTYFKDVVEAGAKVYLYEGGYFHLKTLNIDNVVISVGTANMDIRSFNLDYETNAIIYDEGKAKELEAQFFEDLKSCKEWTLEGYKEFSVGHRFVDSCYRLASPLLKR